MMANIVGCTVVIFVAIAFITLSILYFRSQRRLLESGQEDEALLRDVKKQLRRTRDRYRSVEEAEALFEQAVRKKVAVRRLLWGVLAVLYLAIFGFVLFSNAVSDNRHIWLGDTALLTIRTDSMASVHPLNEETLAELGRLDETDRVEQYSLISISRDPALIAALAPGDVVAFTMRDENGSDVTVIHRLIRIETENGAPRYTFRGDANPSSMSGEMGLSADRIVGVLETNGYRGARYVLLGHFVTYLRSTTGIAMTAVALILIFIYLTLSDRSDRLFEARYTALRHEELERRLGKKPPVMQVYSAPEVHLEDLANGIGAAVMSFAVLLTGLRSRESGEQTAESGKKCTGDNGKNKNKNKKHS